MSEKYLLFSFSDVGEAIDFLEYLTRLIPKRYYTGEIKGKKLKIFIKASPDEVDRIIDTIRKGYSEWRLSKTVIKGVYKHSIPMLLKIAKLKIAIPVQGLRDILYLSGYKSEIKGNILYSDAPLDVIKCLAEVLSEKYDESIYLNATPLVKRLVAVIAALTGKSIDYTVKFLLENGLIRYNEYNKLVLRKKYEDALKDLPNILKRSR